MLCPSSSINLTHPYLILSNLYEHKAKISPQGIFLGPLMFGIAQTENAYWVYPKTLSF